MNAPEAAVCRCRGWGRLTSTISLKSLAVGSLLEHLALCGPLTGLPGAHFPARSKELIQEFTWAILYFGVFALFP